MEKNSLKIDLYPENKPRYKFDTDPLKEFLLDRKVDENIETILHMSLDDKKELGYIYANILFGFYRCHINHLPLIIKPDDVWLLIIQTFSNHVNENAKKLKDLLVNYEGKKQLKVEYPINDIKGITKEILENFSEQMNEEMKKYIGNSLIETLTPNFTTTTKDSEIVCKMTIMGAFKNFFDFQLDIIGCGIPYLILEGTTNDYKKILTKCEVLKKYKFEWYINRIIPCIEKMVQAKEGKIDIDFFKSIVQKKEITENRYAPSGEEPEDMKVKYISGWILKFFGYFCERDRKGKLKIFNQEKIEIDDFRKLSYQMIRVPFKIIDEVNHKEFNGKFEAGFIGCDKNEKNEVFPVKGWVFSILNKKKNEDEEKKDENKEEKREEKKEEKKDEKSKNEEEEKEDEEDGEDEDNISNEEELKNMYKEMEEDEDKYDNINDYYLRKIKFPYMYKNIDEIEQEEEEEEQEEEQEEGENEQ